MSNNKNFVVSEGIASAGLNLVQGDAPVTESTTIGFAPTSDWAYDSVVLDLLDSHTVHDFFISPDGTKLFKLFSHQDGIDYYMYINQYDLTTAWDLSTMGSSYASQTIVKNQSSAFSTYYNTFTMSPDGTRLYYASNSISGQATYYYTLSTPWDLSTRGSASTFLPSTVLTQDPASPATIQFSNDGSRYYYFGINVLLQFTCSTPWDLTTATVLDASNFTSKSGIYETRNQRYLPWQYIDDDFGSYTAMFPATFNNIGTALYVTTSSGSLNSRHHVYKLDLENPWDITSINRLSYSKFNYLNQITNDVHAIRFKPDGTKMYLLDGGNQNLYQYSISSTEDVTKFDLSTGTFFKHSPAADVRYKFINPQDDTHIETVQLEVTNAGTTTGYDLDNASYDSVSFSVAVYDPTPYSIQFKPDGTKFYITGNSSGGKIRQFSLSTAWDLSTASSDSKYYTTGFTTNTNFAIKPDGTKLYTQDYASSTVYEYSISTAWDISTVNSTSTASYTTSGEQAGELRFKPDGTKFYISANGTDSITQYSLSTAWDLSTASTDSATLDVSSQETGPVGMTFNDDGTLVFVTGFVGTEIHQYSLSTAWDISTASYDSVSFDTTTPEGNLSSLFFSSDGTKMYTMSFSSDSIYQFTTGSNSASTITWDDSILWSSYSAPTMPALNETDTFTFQTKNGGVTYIGLASGDNHS